MSQPTGPAPLFVRSPGSRFASVVVWVAVLFSGFAIVRVDRGTDLVFGLAICAAVALAMWMGAWRPAMVISDQAAVIQNTFRDIRIPWPRLEAISAGLSLVLEADSHKYTVWAVSGSNKRRRPGGPGTMGRFGPPGRRVMERSMAPYLPDQTDAQLSRESEQDAFAGKSRSKATAELIEGRWHARRDSGDAAPVTVVRQWPAMGAMVVLLAVIVGTGFAL